MNTETDRWHAVSNESDVFSPALLIYPDRAEENIRRMLGAVGSPDRLRPHMKTHKIAELIRMQMGLGISKFKCATIAETEMVASCGAPDVLFAYQPVGPNIRRLVELVRKYPSTQFSTITDNPSVVNGLSEAFSSSGREIDVLIDVDCGMQRTGIPPNTDAFELYQAITRAKGLRPGGLHVYDGHLHQTDVAERTADADAAYAMADGFRQKLLRNGMSVPRIVMGGTPTFPIHARRPDVECSPGTCVLWDSGYETKVPDLGFLSAAALLTRVVSKPGQNRLCLDLGHKAVAAENPHPRVHFLNLPNATAVIHSEEHLVVETPAANQFKIGDCIYGIPRHICPTVALHSEAIIIRDGRATESWKVSARKRVISV